MNNETKKILISLAKHLRNARRNVREKEKMKEEYNSSYDSVILQARAMAFANTSMYYVAKKEAGSNPSFQLTWEQYPRS